MDKTNSSEPTNTIPLLLYHTVISNGVGIQNYGTALSAGIGKYVNDGTNTMIKLGILEEPPTSADRKKLSKMSPGSRPVE